ncbi:PP2C family protein-serine/threonine phosphatase [Streptomyces sp. MI02-7b]|uniref:PP2C family protein-serine/threonine phosphatase n=1 Tax=Streptomyces sp. MI02-7b TaxID=462941 RepID=UPI0029BD1832|nr:PP2C family protein-serine/threonine phosphatase [Streptomyces sp. MI02-7b]MDX3074099.1 PP2C family protein-serine/threonine phosphatase [Streptomyces sp. MI02-7b]
MDALLDTLHRTEPGRLARVIQNIYADAGLSRVGIFVADLQQKALVELTDARSTQPPQRLAMHASLAGWAFRSESLRIQPGEQDRVVLFVPIIDGVERLGVLRVETLALTASTIRRCQSLAAVVAMALVTKGAYSDELACSQRATTMGVAAEMVWAFLPPRTIGTELITSSAVVEPAYEVGGDAFDHSVSDDVLHVAVTDAMGHDLAAGLTSSVVLAGCRNARRSGADLPAIVRTIDDHLEQLFPDRYATGVLLQLHMTTGHLRWVNCGHPEPYLLREGILVSGAFHQEPCLPLGIRLPEDERAVHHIQLKPGDRILVYTDGVTEARLTGKSFGEDRFIDYINRAVAAGEPAPEVLRRLVDAILASQNGRLSDDATILLFEWHPLREAQGR